MESLGTSPQSAQDAHPPVNKTPRSSSSGKDTGTTPSKHPAVYPFDTPVPAASSKLVRSKKSYHSLQQQQQGVARSTTTAITTTMSRSPSALSVSRGSREQQTPAPTLMRKASTNSIHSVRRVSSTTLRSSPASSTKSPEAPKITPATVARDYFKTELETLHGASPYVRSDTVVFVHDDCYGHRYSRPRTSRAVLSTIVERPERLRATVAGAALAYVRLGERHCDGLYAPGPYLDAAGISDVPFFFRKSRRRIPLDSPVVTNVHGSKWMEELKIMCASAEAKLANNGKELQRPEMRRGSDQSVPEKFHEGDLYLCSDSLSALEGSLGAVCDAVDEVFAPASHAPRKAYVAIRPPGHHCAATWPSGFCWINNVHVGIMHAMMNHGLTHAAIIDIDLHHGDGSQEIAWAHNSRAATGAKNASPWKRTSIGYFSIHDINSYPCEMGDETKIRNASLCLENAHGQDIWNVHLQPWKCEADFWQMYESRYKILLDKCRSFLQHHTQRLQKLDQEPKAAIFISAGFDASEWESSGMQRHQVNVPTEFYARITHDIVKLAAEEDTSVGGRVVSVMEGGYSDRAIIASTLSHLSGLTGGASPTTTTSHSFREVVYDVNSAPVLNGSTTESTATTDSGRTYDPAWWAIGELEAFERTLANLVPANQDIPLLRRVSSSYSSPTQASTAKMVTPLRPRRSRSRLSVSSSTTYVQEPITYPDVPWTVAAHELSKLLIPSDRSTVSCRHEELSAEATRIRKEKQAQSGGSLDTAELSPEDGVEKGVGRMSLRERKPKPIIVDNEKGSRRQTVGDAAQNKVGLTDSYSLSQLAPVAKKLTELSQSRPPSRNISASRRPSSRRLSVTSSAGGAMTSPVEAAAPPFPGIPELTTRPASPPAIATGTRRKSDRQTKPTSTNKDNPAKIVIRSSSKSTRPKSAVEDTICSPTTDSHGARLISSPPPPLPKETDGAAGLVNDMKKVKLTILSKEESEDRARVRAAASEKASAPEKQVSSHTALPTPATTPHLHAISSAEKSNNNSNNSISISNNNNHDHKPMSRLAATDRDPTPKITSPNIPNRRGSVKHLARTFEDSAFPSMSTSTGPGHATTAAVGIGVGVGTGAAPAPPTTLAASAMMNAARSAHTSRSSSLTSILLPPSAPSVPSPAIVDFKSAGVNGVNGSTPSLQSLANGIATTGAATDLNTKNHSHNHNQTSINTSKSGSVLTPETTPPGRYSVDANLPAPKIRQLPPSFTATGHIPFAPVPRSNE